MMQLFRVLGLSCGPSRPGIRSGHEEKRGRSASSSTRTGLHRNDPSPPTASELATRWRCPHLARSERENHKTSIGRLHGGISGGLEEVPAFTEKDRTGTFSGRSER